MTPPRSRPRTRRRVLAALAGTIGLAGCLESGTSADPDGTDGEDGTANAEREDEGTGDGGDEADEGDASTEDGDGSNESTTDDEGDADETGEDADGGDGDGESADGDDAEGEDDGCENENVHEEYEETEVAVATPEGEELGSVTAAIADDGDLRYLGLSDTECLPEDRGMLFVYQEEGTRTFVMRDMDFPIDIVFADGEGTITTIHHAEAPGPDESGEESHHRYPGDGQYVLEVNYEWTKERGVEEGDVLEFDR